MCEGRELGEERGLWAIWHQQKLEHAKMSEESEHGLAWIHVTEYKQPIDAESSWLESDDARDYRFGMSVTV
jgi:hypothetical protein